MRRFASVFLPKRDKNESKKSAAPARKVEEAPPLAIQTAVPLVHSLPPPLQLPSHSSDRAQSSSSSTASASIQTPDDDSPLSRSLTKKSWKSWLGTVKSGTLKRAHLNHSRTSLHAGEPKYDTDLHPLPNLHLPLPCQGNRRVSTFRFEQQTDASTDGSDDANVVLANDTESSPPDPLVARANAKILTQRRLQDATCLPPFVSVTGSPLFPRSCNAPGLPKQHALLATLFRTRLLRRLDDDGIPMEDHDIMQFASLDPGQYVPPRSSLMSSSVDISSVPTGFHVSGFSTGIRRWISRPCFEERYMVWLSEDGVIARKGVTGTSFAVLDLEFTEALEAMAGFDVGSPTSLDAAPKYDTSITETGPTIPIFHLLEQPSANHESVADLDAPVGIPTVQDGSGAVIDAASSSPPSSHSEGEGEEHSTSRSLPPFIPAPTVKRGVRFADDVPDRVPVGYAQGMKKRREEKAKFLHEEQAQRALVVERRKIEEQRRLLEYEKRQREMERMDLEREKQAWEREKRERESADREKQERRERALKDEVTAARLRREAQRAGNVPSGLRESTYAGLDDGLGRSKLHPTFSSSTSLRQDSRERNTAAGEAIAYDPTSRARPPSASIPTRPSTMTISSALSPTTAYGPSHGPSHGTRSSPSNSGSSPGSSRPPSVSGGASYSSHVPEDAGSRMKRHSVASTSTRPFVDRSTTMPSYPTFHGGPLPTMWNGSQQSLNGMVMMAPVNPMMPAQMNTMMFPGVGMVPSMMDMPLLPPTPPFMMQQYRRSSTHSSSSSRDHSLDRQSSRQRESSQGSGRSSGSERVYQRPASSTPSSPHGPSHSRRGSADMSPSAFPASKRSSSGISLNHTSYHPGPSSSSSSLAQGNATNGHRHSQAPSANYERVYSERGRALHPGQSTRSSNSTPQHIPSPWTALPTRHGGLPGQMPPNSGQRQPNSQQERTVIKPSASRRQTFHT